MAEQKFTPRAENVLRLAQETALELGHGYVGCEHILLGLLREDGSAACRALGEAGVTEEQLRGMHLYLGRITLTSRFNFASAFGSAYITSPSPPVFTNG